MDGRFFGVPRSSRRSPAYYYSVPAARSPKVVSIPVHFVEDETTRRTARSRTRSREESAGRIQAAFRGFVVRKCVRKLDAVRREVEGIERRICEVETTEAMRRDERERLKVNEALMSLLFRLDSVRGVDDGVRELRKKVIRKAIALQEKVDAIAAAAGLADQKDGGAAEVEMNEGGGDVEKAEMIEKQLAESPDREEGGDDAIAAAADLVDQKDGGAAEVEMNEGGGDVEKAEMIEKQLAESPDQEEGGDVVVQCEEEPVSKDYGSEAECEEEPASKDYGSEAECEEEPASKDYGSEADGADEAKKTEDQVSDGSSIGLEHVTNDVNGSGARDLAMEIEPPMSESSGESRGDPSLYPESFLEEVDENAPVKEEDETEHSNSFEEKGEEDTAAEEDRKANNRSEEILGRMMEDNEKMMGMLTQLFERHERQTQLLGLLSQRVERLEKAFLCEKLRRKKRRDTGEGDNRSPKSNKCGKKL